MSTVTDHRLPIIGIADGVARALLEQQESVVRECIRGLCNGSVPTLVECKRRGQLNIWPDGTEIFMWDGQAQLKFGPICADYTTPGAARYHRNVSRITAEKEGQ